MSGHLSFEDSLTNEQRESLRMTNEQRESLRKSLEWIENEDFATRLELARRVDPNEVWNFRSLYLLPSLWHYVAVFAVFMFIIGVTLKLDSIFWR